MQLNPFCIKIMLVVAIRNRVKRMPLIRSEQMYFLVDGILEMNDIKYVMLDL
ncbi:hypothetical protein D3C75_659720 [compost metagenome]